MKDIRLFLSDFLKRSDKGPESIEKIMNNIENAVREVTFARANFNMAVGDDNVELAIYELSTAEIKYRNLIREAKRLGIVNEQVPAFPKTEGECI